MVEPGCRRRVVDNKIFLGEFLSRSLILIFGIRQSCPATESRDAAAAAMGGAGISSGSNAVLTNSCRSKVGRSQSVAVSLEIMNPDDFDHTDLPGCSRVPARHRPRKASDFVHSDALLQTAVKETLRSSSPLAVKMARFVMLS